MTRRLIVNADDFGLTPGVNAGILGAHRHGIVSSTTVLTTAAIDAESVSALRDSDLGVGIHLNLTLGRPLSRARSLVDADGRFVRDARHAAARADAKDVEREVRAQIEKLARTLGTTVPAFEPPIDRGAVALYLRHNYIPAPYSIYEGIQKLPAAAYLTLPADQVGALPTPRPYWSLPRTLAQLRVLPPGVSEFMSHPGWFDEALAYSRYGRQRETEMVGLGTPAARAALASLGITLCHFGEL